MSWEHRHHPERDEQAASDEANAEEFRLRREAAAREPDYEDITARQAEARGEPREFDPMGPDPGDRGVV